MNCEVEGREPIKAILALLAFVAIFAAFGLIMTGIPWVAFVCGLVGGAVMLCA